MTWLVLLVALALSAVAAYYSIVGLVAIFAAAALPIAIMGSVLEVAKLVTASWLYRNWKQAPFLLKTYFSTAIAVLMLITSMGIYGFLSKAHIDQGINAGDSVARIEFLEQKIAQENTTINRYQTTLDQLDQAIEKFNELGAVTKGLAARNEQAPEREAINAGIDSSYQKIEGFNSEIAQLKSEVRAFEVEVGPIKYIAELLFEGENVDVDRAVRYVILCLIFVFDPLAVLLVIAANMDFNNREPKRREVVRSRRERTQDKQEPIVETRVVKDADVEVKYDRDKDQFEFIEKPLPDDRIPDPWADESRRRKNL